MNLPESLALVSIVTPVYNGAKYLDELIVSVRDQNYPRVEHIVIDDGSNDHGATLAVLRRYPHLRWWSRENRGQYATMNEGLEAASGEIICFISADDVMAKDAIRAAMTCLLEHPKYPDGVYGKYSYIDEKNAAYWYQPLIHRAPLAFYRYSPFIAHCSLYLRRGRLIEQGLYFNPSLRYVGDYDWLVRFGEVGLSMAYLDKTLSHVRWHEDRASNTSVKPIKQELARVMSAHGVNPRAFRWINVSIDGLLMLKKLLLGLLAGRPKEELRQLQTWLAARRGR